MYRLISTHCLQPGMHSMHSMHDLHVERFAYYELTGNMQSSIYPMYTVCMVRSTHSLQPGSHSMQSTCRVLCTVCKVCMQSNLHTMNQLFTCKAVSLLCTQCECSAVRIVYSLVRTVCMVCMQSTPHSMHGLHTEQFAYYESLVIMQSSIYTLYIVCMLSSTHCQQPGTHSMHGLHAEYYAQYARSACRAICIL